MYTLIYHKTQHVDLTRKTITLMKNKKNELKEKMHKVYRDRSQTYIMLKPWYKINSEVNRKDTRQ